MNLIEAVRELSKPDTDVGSIRRPSDSYEIVLLEMGCGIPCLQRTTSRSHLTDVDFSLEDILADDWITHPFELDDL